ncbi:MAG: tetratricopeptide repeat protein [Methylobacteriaceae bacterium]|nr:tetratricopeptide repeat protein [Methylobacteriaceae bacterium]MBV9220563.1 tetratricopeptide repeat protein [Methylobacteriaceae bacterium]MBV9245407.1 tetratricopeptide repeat protein [Methylobacteriaceae bacterium]MBV9633081.1 tetratricopeptide repeat protein [Methylobacteriaceae bacterium]MBV9703612.1 tetratricopeptide repeat protein [Methylobacteriaceae bacterium]
MTDIFREVDEDVRRDKAIEFWKKYQSLLIGIALIIVLATAGWRAYQYWQVRMAQSASAHYEKALELARAGKGGEAQAELDRLVAKAPSGYRTLARLRLAAEAGKSDPVAGAKAFDALAADASIGSTFQEIARLRAAMLLMDTADPRDIRNRLEPLAAAGGAFRHTARELLALSALKVNDTEAAGRWLDMIEVDPETPADLRKRADALLGLVRGAKAATG